MRAAAGLCVAICLTLAALSAGAPAAAHGHGTARPPAAPPGFFGVVPQAPLGEADLGRMRGTVETLRLPIF